MAVSQLSSVMAHLRRLVLLRDSGGLTDEKLLESFVTRHEEAAFEVLVRRHGAMVMGVCHRVLRRHHDAEDAFQATFLILARKAAAIASPELLSNWLYGVAYKTALKAKAAVARRRKHESDANMPKSAEPPTDDSRDLLALLDKELSCLPEKYRALIVLCELEGKTRKEAAERLGCPEGTVAGRLARARALLAKRLKQRGVVLSAAVLAGQDSLSIASASVPIPLITSTSKAAVLFAAGQTVTGVVSSQVAALAAAVLQTMLVTKLKTIAVAALALSLLTWGGGGFLIRSSAAAPFEPSKSEIADTADQVRPMPSRQAAEVANADGGKTAARDGAMPSKSDEKETLPDGAIARLGAMRFNNFGRPYCVDFAPNSKTLAIGSWDGTLSCWNLDTLELHFQNEGHSGPVQALAFSPDGTSLATADNEIRIWQSANGKPIMAMPDRELHIKNLYFSPNGTFLAATSPTHLVGLGTYKGGHVNVWNVATQRFRWGYFSAYEGIGHGAAFHDDLTFAFLHHARPKKTTIKIVDANSNKVKKEVDLPLHPWPGSVMSPTGKWFVAYADQKLQVVDVPAQKVIAHAEFPFVSDFVVSPDERFIAGFVGSRVAACIELRTGLVRRQFQVPDGNTRCLAVSPDGRFMASGSIDQSVLLWDLTGRRLAGKLSPVALSAAQLDPLWSDLDSSDGVIVHRAVWTLIAAARDSMPYLRRKLILPPPDAERAVSLIRDLENDNFKVRATAESELEKLGYQAEAALRRQLAKSPSLEGRRRIEKLLELLDTRWNGSRMLRVIEVLERCGTAEARQLLQQLAQMEGGGGRADEAKAALRRFDRAAGGMPR